MSEIALHKHFTLKQNNQIHQYNTRQKNNLHIPRTKNYLPVNVSDTISQLP